MLILFLQEVLDSFSNMTTSEETHHIWISGLVQGVYYRNNTVNTANKLGLSGWCRNLSDTRVEVIVKGPVDKLAELHQWCRKGPEAANVEQVDWKLLESYDEVLKSPFQKIPKKHEALKRGDLKIVDGSGAVLPGIKHFTLPEK